MDHFLGVLVNTCLSASADRWRNLHGMKVRLAVVVMGAGLPGFVMGAGLSGFVMGAGLTGFAFDFPGLGFLARCETSASAVCVRPQRSG